MVDAKQLWLKLLSEGNNCIPLVRELAISANRDHGQCEFQFSHLSIQEYFLAVGLVEGDIDYHLS